MELLPGFLLYPRVRSKTKSINMNDKLSEQNSIKSFNTIRSKLETDPSDNIIQMEKNIIYIYI